MYIDSREWGLLSSIFIISVIIKHVEPFCLVISVLLSNVFNVFAVASLRAESEHLLKNGDSGR